MTIYNNNIPQPNDTLDVSQKQILDNFKQLDTTFGIDHFKFSVVPNNGKHTQVRLPIRGGGTGTIPAGLVAGEGTLYTKQIAGIKTELFYTPDNSTNEYRLTNTSASNISTLGANIAYGTPPATFTQIGGWSFIAGGLVYQYGFFGKSGATGTSGTIQFPRAFATGAYTISLVLYRNSGNQSVCVDTSAPPNTTQFKFLASTAGSDGIYWTAVGN